MEWQIIVFFVTIITLEFTLIYCLCTRRITVFDIIRPSDTSDSNERIRESQDIEVGQFELPIKEIPINPPNVVIIESPGNQINIGIKLNN